MSAGRRSRSPPHLCVALVAGRLPPPSGVGRRWAASPQSHSRGYHDRLEREKWHREPRRARLGPYRYFRRTGAVVPAVCRVGGHRGLATPRFATMLGAEPPPGAALSARSNTGLV